MDYKMRIYVDQAEADQSRVPTFRVELRNVGETDLLLNLGIMTHNGERQYPTAVSLILANSQGESQRLELKGFRQVSGSANETLFPPLPAGAAFSLPVDLDSYWSAASKEFDRSLKPGSYSLVAQFNGSIETNVRRPFPRQQEIPGQQPGLVFTFDIVNPQVIGIPTSNRLLTGRIPNHRPHCHCIVIIKQHHFVHAARRRFALPSFLAPSRHRNNFLEFL
jgi:hypothetical protein